MFIPGVLADALAWLDCTIYSRTVAGTHTIYVGEIQASLWPDDMRRTCLENNILLL